MEVDRQPKKSEDVREAPTAEEAEYKKRDAVWPVVLFYIHLYVLGMYGVYVAFTSASWTTIFFSEFASLGNINPDSNQCLGIRFNTDLACR